MSSQTAKSVAVTEAFTQLEARPFQRAGMALDLVYLARQSLGDKKLETELLALFDRQSGQVIERLTHIKPDADPQWPRDLAHTLTGSARAVGAHGVAAASQAYEAMLGQSYEPAALATALQILAEEVEIARACIRDVLA
ncbi:MAG: Hpt domain-containing protein [Beijerinckiaceae bacterium]|jgi:HPt (histidine-containing phosphotransfer) domain-containing protein|nr:Hpt domain-containing protein [Beijerinckiaceae bacterium]MBX9761311.1 Hpt domain-containing protein [Beijerinckiaceae bacterium]